MRRRNATASKKLQITVDVVTERLLDEIATLGIHGTTKAEVASTLVRQWIWHNDQRLRENGVRIGTQDAPT